MAVYELTAPERQAADDSGQHPVSPAPTTKPPAATPEADAAGPTHGRPAHVNHPLPN